MNPRNFFAELKRRNVYKVAVAYAVAGWLAMQVASTIVPALHLAEGITSAVVVLVLVGFPIALLLAWAFEMTLEGIARTENVVGAPQKHNRHLWIYVVVVGATLSAALFFLGRYTAAVSNSSSSGDKSIAVLPLVNQSGDPAQEYFSDGLSDELINVLGQIDDVRVIGRNSSFHFKGKTDDSRAIGLALGVANLLEGSVRKSGEHLRISVQLVNASNGSQRWSQTYDRELKDVFAVQEEIAKSVADELRVRLLGRAVSAPGRGRQDNLPAYNAYLQGQFYYQMRNRDANAKALSFFEEAIRLDANYAEAYVAKAQALFFVAGFEGWEARQTFEQARAAALSAIALKPDLANAHAAIAYVYLVADWNVAAADAEVSRIAASEYSVLTTVSFVRKIQGRFDDALTLQKKAIEVDPVNAFCYSNLGVTFSQLGRFDEAEQVLRRAIELQPGAQGPHSYLALVALLRGQPDLALREALLEPAGVRRDTAIAVAQFARGDRAEADAALQRLLTVHRGDLRSSIALVYAYEGEGDTLFEWLNGAYVAHEPWLIHLLWHPLLQRYRADSRFIELCHKMNVLVPK